MRAFFIRISGFGLILFLLTACIPPVTINGAGAAEISPADICAGKTINGVAGTAVCANAPAAFDVTQSFASGNFNSISNAPASCSYLSTVTLFGTSGTMIDRGDLDPSATWGGAGYYSGFDVNALTASDVCSSKSIFGQVGTGVCQSGTVVDAAQATDVVNGKEYFNSTGALVTGTLALPTDRGAWDMRSSFPGAGAYAGVSHAPSASRICSSSSGGQDVAGTSGTAVCESNTATIDATLAPKLLSATSLYDSSGKLVTGSMTNQGSWDVSTSAFPGTGYYSGASSSLSTGQVCIGSKILSANGTAICNSLFGDLMASGVFRNLGSTQSTLSGEVNQGSCNSGGYTTRAGCEAAAATWTPSAMDTNYRVIPDDRIDGDGLVGDGAVIYALRPANNCGTIGSIVTRIADCATQNTSRATWNGANKGVSNESTWKLVTRNGALKEVWQDQRTGLIWSSLVATGVINSQVNWCTAAGVIAPAPVTLSQVYNSAAGTPMTGNGTITNISGGSSSATETITITFTGPIAVGVAAGTCGSGGAWTNNLTNAAGTTAVYTNAAKCSFTLTQGSTPFANGDTIIVKSTAATSYSCVPGAVSALQPLSAISACAEDGSLVSAISGELWSAGTYSAAKGNMGLNSTTRVRWRLPTFNDYQQARIDGIMFVMPDIGIVGSARTAPDATTAGVIEWTATPTASFRAGAYIVTSNSGSTYSTTRGFTAAARCVGR